MVLLLAGCGSSSIQTSAGTLATNSSSSGAGSTTIGSANSGSSQLTGKLDTVVATASVSGSLTALVGKTQTLSITFTSSDGLPITGFAISGTTLPTGWSAPANFTCALVDSGSGCVLNLSYAPTATDSGTLTVNYIFVNNAHIPESPGGSISIPYSAGTANDVLASVAPTGQVTALVGEGSQSIAVTFTTDDGFAATNLSATPTLPAGWSSSVATLSCAIVSAGNGCQLGLTYAPKAAGSGSLTLNYAYTDGTGAARTAAVNIPYTTTSHDNVIATASPVGQVNAIEKTGSQAVAISFTTDDGKTASQLFLTDATTLPAGWSGNLAGFACASISVGNGCQLHLAYAPTALTTGTLSLTYGYTDSAGTAQMGTLDLDYAATTNDNVTATPSPMGEINAVVGAAAQTVTVTFTTDDTRLATALAVTTNLAALPAGWSSSADPFSCASLTTGTGCQLTLTYLPTLAAKGTLRIGYSYRNNAGESKTGTVSVPYRATTNDTIVATPSVTTLAELTGSSTPVTVTFATNDGNPASALSVTTDLATLPAGWSATANAFACSTVSAGTVCELTLNYAPTIASTGTLSLAFSYLNDSGYPGTGSTSIAYTASVPTYLYVADAGGNAVSSCPINVDNSLAACVATGAGFTTPNGVAVGGTYGYVTNTSVGSVSVCTLGTGGTLSACSTANGTFSTPTSATVNPTATFAYVGQGTPTSLVVCPISSVDGTLSACVQASASTGPTSGLALSADGNHAYSVVSATAGSPPVMGYTINVCDVAAADGTLTNCAATGTNMPAAATALAIEDGNLYAMISTGALFVCPVNADASLGACVQTAVGLNAVGIAASGGNAYLSTGLSAGANSLFVCPIATGGLLGACQAFSDPTLNGATGLSVR
jgi:hypothetical protein